MTEAEMSMKSTMGMKGESPDPSPNLLDKNSEINLRETLQILGRGVMYIRYFKLRFTAKLLFSVGGLIPPLLLPWPVKVIIDHVILGMPIEGSNYPWFFNWFAQFLDGKTPVVMMLYIILFGAVTILLFGAYSEKYDSGVYGELWGGHDIATKTENEANDASSKVGGMIGLMEYWMNLRLTQGLNHLLRSQLFERIKSLPMTKLDDQRIGDSVFRIMYDTASMTNIFFNVILGPTMIIIGFVNAALVFIGSYSGAPEIIVISLFLIPVQILAVGPFSRFVRRRSQASRAAGSVATGNIEEGMSNVLAVQSLGGNKRELKRFDKDSGESFKRYRSQYFLDIIVGQAGRLGSTIAFLTVQFLCLGRVIDGTLTPGDFSVVFFYYGWMSGSANALPIVWIHLQNNVAGMRRVFFFLDMPTERTQGGSELPPITAGIEMKRAGLTYPDGREALKGIDLEGRIGEIVALVGPTGAGKTTLAHLVPGYHQATAGEVLIDGTDVRDISPASLRRQVSYVFQETQLFSDSIIDNIRYGSPDVTREQVEHAARVAGAHDFITELPDGYETKLGTVTSKLSVGQKQRIAIARGLVRDARILILDEPTSALDPETEEHLVDALHEAAKDKLVIVIAHRLSTIAQADRIYFLEKGEMLEQGSHEELMARDGGKYRKYVGLQGAKG